MRGFIVSLKGEKNPEERRGKIEGGLKRKRKSEGSLR